MVGWVVEIETLKRGAACFPISAPRVWCDLPPSRFPILPSRFPRLSLSLLLSLSLFFSATHAHTTHAVSPSLPQSLRRPSILLPQPRSGPIAPTPRHTQIRPDRTHTHRSPTHPRRRHLSPFSLHRGSDCTGVLLRRSARSPIAPFKKKISIFPKYLPIFPKYRDISDIIDNIAIF